MRSGGTGGAADYFRVPAAERRADSAESLAGAMFILDKRETYEAVAVLSEADTRRHRDFGLREQKLGEVERAHRAPRLRNRRPHEHRRFGFLDRPSGAIQTVNQHVAAALVRRIDLADAFLRAIERRDRRNLNRREHPVIKI